MLTDAEQQGQLEVEEVVVRQERLVRGLAAVPPARRPAVAAAFMAGSAVASRKSAGVTRIAAPVGQARTQAGPPAMPLHRSHLTASLCVPWSRVALGRLVVAAAILARTRAAAQQQPAQAGPAWARPARPCGSRRRGRRRHSCRSRCRCPRSRPRRSPPGAARWAGSRPCSAGARSAGTRSARGSSPPSAPPRGPGARRRHGSPRRPSRNCRSGCTRIRRSAGRRWPRRTRCARTARRAGA